MRNYVYAVSTIATHLQLVTQQVADQEWISPTQDFTRIRLVYESGTVWVGMPLSFWATLMYPSGV